MFALSVAAVVAAVWAGMRLAWVAAFGALPPPRGFDAVNLLVPLLLVVGGALVESASLRHGGAGGLVERLGARAADPRRPLERRLRNCVEELAVASGLPVPRVHLLDDDAINAMAVGFSPADAALVFTRGALERLTRDELQGVVAHETGHVAGGDMRLNTQLMGWVWGLELLWRLGWKLMWAARDGVPGRRAPRGRGGRSVGALAVPGLLLFAAGALGWSAARLLKAAAGREAEFLADARALQWTRSRDGIGGALRRIKGQAAGGVRLAGPEAQAFSHCWLAEPAAGWLDTHPPIDARIRRLYGRAMPALDAGPRPENAREAAQAAAPAFAPIEWTGGADAPGARAASAGAGAGASAGIGAPADHAGWPRRLRPPSALLDRPGAAVALLQVLLEREQPAAALDADAAAPAGTGHAALVAAWRAEIDRLQRASSAAWRLPLLELACARLREQAPSARARLVGSVEQAAQADGRVTPLEALLLVVLRHRLAPREPSGTVRLLAHPADAARAAAACDALLAGADAVDPRALADAVDALAALPMLAKPAIARRWQRRLDPARPDAAARAELLRALCAAIDCPAPIGSVAGAAEPSSRGAAGGATMAR